MPANSLEVLNFSNNQPKTPLKKSDGMKAPKAGVQKNNFLTLNDKVDERNPLACSDMRIETYSSIEHDGELTAKEKQRKKICKYIRLGF